LDLLRGLDEQALVQVTQRLQLTEGAERLVQNLKKLGYKIAIISGGFTYFGEYLKRRLGLDYVHANELQIVAGKVTGKVVGEIVDGPKKAELLREIARREGIRMEQAISTLGLDGVLYLMGIPDRETS